MSESAANAETRVTVDRWHTTYLVPAGQFARQPAAQDLLERIDRCIAEELPEAVERHLAYRLPQSSEAVWRIREIQLDFVVDVAAPGATEISTDWGDRVAAAVAGIVADGKESEEALRFENRAAYQAQFALDLAAGYAWGKWYYEEFRSLQMLSPGRAIAELLTREPEDGAQTILSLARIDRLEEVLCVLTERDAQTICELCFSGFMSKLADSSEGLGRVGRTRMSAAGFDRSKPPDAVPSESAVLDSPPPSYIEPSRFSAELSQWAGRLLAIWNEEAQRPQETASVVYRDALLWLARAALPIPGTEQDLQARAAIEGLLALRRVLGSMRSPLAADRLVRGLAQREVSLDQAIASAIRDGADAPANALLFLAQIAEGDPDWAAQVAAVLLKGRRPSTHGAYAGESMLTLFGGVFLLGPELVKLQEIVTAAAASGEQTEEFASYLRYVLLAKCLGSARAIEAMADPALRLLSGSRRAGLRDGWQSYAALDPSRIAASMTRQFVELTRCDGRFLLAEAIPQPARNCTIVLVKDTVRNHWLWVSLVSDDPAELERELLSGIDAVREATGTDPYLVLRPSLAMIGDSPSLRARAQQVFVLDNECASDELEQALLDARTGSGPIPPANLSSALASSEEEISYFSFSRFWPDFDLALDLFATFMARAALRGLASRLFGFQSSSPEFLFRNFLEGVGAVRDVSSRVEVELPRSPLLLVLQLSGLARQSYAVPWLEGKDVCLLPPRE